MKKKREAELSGRDVVRTLKGSLREFKAPSIATPIIVSGEVVMEVAIPFVTAQLINSIQAGATLSDMLPYAGILVLMALASLAFGIGAGVTCSQASCGLAMNLRHDVFAAVQRFSFANIDQFSSSSLVTRLTTDITNVQLAYMMIIRTAIRCPFLLLAGIVMAFIMAGPLALVFLIIVPLLGFGLFKVVRTVHPIFRSVFHKYDALNESIEENVTGMRDVKSYVRQDYEKEKFGRAAQDVCADFTRAEKILALNTPMMNFAVYTVFAVTLQFGSYLIISSRGSLLNVGQLSALTTYGFMILMALMMVSMVFAMITMAQESAERICEVLTTEPTIKNPAHPETEMVDGSIDFDNVTFKYSEKAEHRALAEIDLHIKSGETIGVMGGTGSAKTSLVNLISRLYDVTEGSVKVGGVDVRDYDLEFLRNTVAVVLQKNVLFSGTINENLRWGNPDATYYELAAQEVRLLHRAGRHQRLRRTEAAPVHRARPSQAPQGADPGRLHLRRRHQDRRPHPRGPQDLPARGHQDNHRPARELGAGRRPHPRAGQRPHRRARHPRGAPRELPVLPRHLPRAEPHEPGGREGRRREGRGARICPARLAREGR